jgi:hypothetical protein
MLPHPDSSGNDQVFFPYWRLKGTLYTSGHSGTEHRFIDLSRQALESEYFPASIGFRSQALKLKFALPETGGTFIKQVILPEEVIRSIRKVFSPQIEKKTGIQAFTGKTASIIYAPFHVIGGKLYDSILGTPALPNPSGDFDINIYPAEKPDWPITFIPAICPDCGWDLAGERDSLALLCGNCDSAWHTRDKRLAKINVGYIPGESDDNLFLPFWMIKAGISGIDSGLHPGLIKQNRPRDPDRRLMDNSNRIFWIPAFKIRAHHFLRIAKQMTFVQPSHEVAQKAPDGTIHPVTLPIAEAIDSIKIIISDFIKIDTDLLSLLLDAVIIPESFHLVYIPFKTDYHDLINEKYHIALNNNVLSTAGNL